MTYYFPLSVSNSSEGISHLELLPSGFSGLKLFVGVQEDVI